MPDAPDPLLSSPPDVTAEAATRLLRDRFGLAETSLTLLGSERDQNFRVEAAGGGRFLLKISNPADGLAVVEMQTAALRHIEVVDPGLPVMRTLPGLTGELFQEVAGQDGRLCPARLLTFLPGRTTPAAELTRPALTAFGQVSARLGRALRGFFHPAAGYQLRWDISRAAGLRPLLGHVTDPVVRTQAEQVLDRFEARVAPALPGLRAQVIHADLSLGNVLLGDDLRPSGIIDFGDMTHAPLVCDLAVAVADVLYDRGDAVEAAESMIRGYVSVTPLEDGEVDLLADLVATRLAAAVIINAWRPDIQPGELGPAGGGQGGTSHGAGARRTVFLDQMEAAGLEEVSRRFADAARALPYRSAATGDLLARRRRVMPRSPLFYRQPVHLVRGEGPWLFDPAGRRYLDCYNNVAVLGHAHPGVAHAVAQQQRLLATHSRYLHEAIVELSERLVASLPPGLDSVLLVNSGSEANDLAWRIARAATGRSGAIVSAHAYHGLTEATHALSPEEWAGERPAHVATIPAPDGYRGRYRREEMGWEARYAAHVDEAAGSLGSRGLAAAFADPFFTADGILVPPPAYLREVAARVRAQGGLLVADEVQSGHGRCGSQLWSFQAAGVEPDLVVMGKPMGNGFPVAAVVARSGLLAAVPEGVELFSTFGGNPVAGAAALAVLDAIEAEDLVRNAAVTGAHLRRGLAELAARYPVIGDVRGEGLVAGVELVADPAARTPAPGSARAVSEALRERGILAGVTGPDGNVLKIRPPLVWRPEHADLLLEALDAVLPARPENRVA